MKTMAHLDPKNDYAFKKLFGTEKNKIVMLGFLNDILKGHRGHKPIADIEYLTPLHDPTFIFSKPSCVDVVCTDVSGYKYIVEMQMINHNGFVKRCQYYAAKTYAQQAVLGKDYTWLKETILIVVANFIVFPEKKNFLSRHLILDETTQEQDLKDISFVFLELPKFKKKEIALNSDVDYWCYFLKNAKDTSIFTIEEATHDHREICYAHKALNEIAMDEQEQLTYDAAEKATMDALSRENTAREKGMKEGIEKGKKEGIEQGKEEGIREANKKTIQSLLASGFDIETILKIMNISQKDYQGLIQ
jgi:predicted transposase/invertase (TIGR01784 family)